MRKTNHHDAGDKCDKKSVFKFHKTTARAVLVHLTRVLQETDQIIGRVVLQGKSGCGRVHFAAIFTDPDQIRDNNRTDHFADNEDDPVREM